MNKLNKFLSLAVLVVFGFAVGTWLCRLNHKPANIANFIKSFESQMYTYVSIDSIVYIGTDGRVYSELRARPVNGRWIVESSLPIRIKLKDGYIENRGDSIALGFEYVSEADDLRRIVEYKKR